MTQPPICSATGTASRSHASASSGRPAASAKLASPLTRFCTWKYVSPVRSNQSAPAGRAARPRLDPKFIPDQPEPRGRLGLDAVAAEVGCELETAMKLDLRASEVAEVQEGRCEP